MQRNFRIKSHGTIAVLWLCGVLLAQNVVVASGSYVIDYGDLVVDGENQTFDITLANASEPQFQIVYSPELFSDTEQGFDLVSLVESAKWRGDNGFEPIGPGFDTGVLAFGFASSLTGDNWGETVLSNGDPFLQGNLAYFDAEPGDPNGYTGGGQFIGTSNHFIAVRFPGPSEETLYGWIEISIDAEAGSLTLHRAAWHPWSPATLRAGEIFADVLSYFGWAEEVFGANAEDPHAQPSASWNQDGIVNLLGYVTGWNPVTGTGGELPKAEFSTEYGRLRVVFTRNPAVQSVRIKVQSSSSLSDWQTIAISEYGDPVTVGPDATPYWIDEELLADGIQRRVTVVDGETITSQKRRFLRVAVEQIFEE